MWFHNTNRRLHLDLHMPEWNEEILKDFDAKQIVDNVVKSKSQALYFFAKDCYGNAYYDTKTGHKHKNMGGRDFLKEILEQTKKSGIYTVVYYSMVYDTHIGMNHPDWVMKDEKGAQVSDTWPYICFNSPYIEYVKQMVKELVENYPIDGIHFDMMNFGFGGLSCYCDNCKKLFYNKTGRKIPETPTWDETWKQFLEFRNDTITFFAGELRAAAQNVNPNVGTVFNYHGSPGFDWRVGQKPVKHASLGSQTTGESYPPTFGIVYTSMEARFLNAVVPGNVSEIVNNRFNTFCDYTIKPISQLKWEVLTGLANGPKVMVVDQIMHTGKVDPVVYERLAEVFGEIEEKDELWGGTAVKHIGLYYSSKTRDFYARGDLPKYLLSFTGVFRALMECHLPVDILCDENCLLEKLKQYKVVFLANIASMDENEADMFRQYVEQGGTLVSTGDTSLHDENGNLRRDFILADVFGVSYEGKAPTKNHYIKIEDVKLGEGIHPEEYTLCNGEGNVVKLKGGNGIGSLHMSFYDRKGLYQTFSHNIPSPYKEVGPAFVINNYGKGMSIYSPSMVCGSYANIYNLPAHRMLIKNMVNYNAAAEFVIDAPLNVEVVINEQKERNRLVIHLIGFNGKKQVVTLQSNMAEQPIVPGPTMEEPLMYKACIKLPTEKVKISCWGEPLKMEQKGDKIELICNRVHEAVIVEFTLQT